MAKTPKTKQTPEPVKRPRGRPRKVVPPTVADLGIGGDPAPEAVAPVKRGRGRPQFEASDAERAQVMAMASFGIPVDQMVELIRRPVAGGGTAPISPVTLRKHFAEELARAEPFSNSRVAQSLFNTATATKGDGTFKHKGHLQAAIFWLKTRAGWREAAAPVDDPFNFDLADLSSEELRVVERIMERRADNVVPFTRKA